MFSPGGSFLLARSALQDSGGSLFTRPVGRKEPPPRAPQADACLPTLRPCGGGSLPELRKPFGLLVRLPHAGSRADWCFASRRNRFGPPLRHARRTWRFKRKSGRMRQDSRLNDPDRGRCSEECFEEFFFAMFGQGIAYAAAWTGLSFDKPHFGPAAQVLAQLITGDPRARHVPGISFRQ